MVAYFPKNTTLVPKFDKAISRMTQAGLIGKWKRYEMDKVALLKRRTKRFQLGRNKLSLGDTVVAFTVAGFGLSTAFIVFAIENIWSRINVALSQGESRTGIAGLC